MNCSYATWKTNSSEVKRLDANENDERSQKAKQGNKLGTLGRPAHARHEKRFQKRREKAQRVGTKRFCPSRPRWEDSAGTQM